jgi:four helix bundle protein
MSGKHVEQPPADIAERTLDYGVRAVKLFRALRGGAARIVGRQYLRSATSVAANVAEAQSGETRADFVHKYAIALKEANESLYWLRLLAKSGLVPANRLTSLVDETEQITAIIASIIVRSKRKAG